MSNFLRRPVVAPFDWVPRIHLGLAMSLSIQISVIAPIAAIAQTVPPATSADTGNATSTHSQSAGNLDLSSTQTTFHARNTAPVDIHVGGVIENGSIVGAVTQSITPGQLLTPAQFLAVNEVLRGGQTLLLNDVGQAIGGAASISSARVHQLGSIVVPQNVSLNAIGFNAANPLNVSGNVNVLGSLFTLQTAPDIMAVLQLGSLNIGAGGVLSGNAPAGIANVFSSSGMTINVLNSVTNMGTISTLGNLNINAGGSILNQSYANTAALLSAQNINLVSGAGQIVNSGLIQALNNINLNTLNSLTGLSVHSTGGIMQAINGAINLRDLSFSGAGATELIGGDWLSKELNFNSAQGSVSVAVGHVSGTVSVDASEAHVLVDTPQLILGHTNISGDPTYVNAGGNIQIVGTLTETENLAIVASGDITASGAARIVNHGNTVWLIAGALVDTAIGSCVGCGNSGAGLSAPGGTASQISSGYVYVSAVGAKGGSIDLQSGNTLAAGNVVIDTSSVSAGGNGGDVNLIALGNGAVGGQILFPSTSGVTSIKTSGSTTGFNGNILIIGGASTGQAVSVGEINAFGATGEGAGQVMIYAGQPTFSGGASNCGSCMSFDSTGTARGGIESRINSETNGVYLLPVNSSIALTGPITVGHGTGGGTFTARTPNGSLQVTSPIFARSIELRSASGNVGTLSTPLQVNAGGAGLGIFVSSGLVNIADAVSEPVVLANTDVLSAPAPLTATSSFALAAAGDIFVAYHSSAAIASPSIALSTTGGDIGRDAAGDHVGLITTASATLTVNASGKEVNITNTGVISNFSASTSGTLTFTNNGNVTLGGNIDSPRAFISLSGQDNVLDFNGNKINATSDLVIRADQLVIGSGSINDHSQVRIRPFSSSGVITLGSSGGGLHFSNQDLGRIAVNDLVIGEISQTYGSMTINGVVDISSYGYDMELYSGQFINNGTLQASKQNITVGARGNGAPGGGTITTGNISNNGASNNYMALSADSMLINGTVSANLGSLTLTQNATGAFTQSRAAAQLPREYCRLTPLALLEI